MSLPIRSLIVEDNVDDEVLLLRQLQKSQLHQQVRIISDGAIALDYLTSAQFSCEYLIAVFLTLLKAINERPKNMSKPSKRKFSLKRI